MSIPPQKHANAPPASFPFEPERISVLPVHPWSATGFHSRVRTERYAHPIGASCIRYREFGGEWRVSDTAKSQFGQNQRDSYMGFTSRLNKEQADLILYGMNSGSSIKIKCMENQEIRIENNKYSSDSIFMRAET
jgi:hypothetical protein